MNILVKLLINISLNNTSVKMDIMYKIERDLERTLALLLDLTPNDEYSIYSDLLTHRIIFEICFHDSACDALKYPVIDICDIFFGEGNVKIDKDVSSRGVRYILKD